MAKNTKQNTPQFYTTISIPIKLMEEVRKVREEHPQLGYVTDTEFVKAAIREKVARVTCTDRV